MPWHHIVLQVDASYEDVTATPESEQQFVSNITRSLAENLVSFLPFVSPDHTMILLVKRLSL